MDMLFNAFSTKAWIPISKDIDKNMLIEADKILNNLTK
jgi:hypothetical protein